METLVSIIAEILFFDGNNHCLGCDLPRTAAVAAYEFLCTAILVPPEVVSKGVVLQPAGLPLRYYIIDNFASLFPLYD